MAAISVLLPAFVSAQEQLRTIALAPRGIDHYASIASIRELGDGSVLVSDPEAATIWRVGFDGLRQQGVREGSVIGIPGFMRALRGDTTLLFDRRDAVFRVLSPDGSVAAAPASFLPPQGTRRVALSHDIYASDAHGSLYWLERTGPSTATAPLIRRTPHGSTATVATLTKAPTTSAGQGGMRVTRSIPFAPLDAWAVGDDGTIVVARGVPYRLDRIGPDGALHAGTPVALPLSPVSTEDREARVQRTQRELGALNLDPAAMSAALPDVAFPDTMGPFEASAIRIAPNGQAWVHRAESARADRTRIDIFVPGGAYRETLVLPKGAVIVGFGARLAFVAIPVGDSDAVTLQSFAWR